jgi:hypothetical protein
LNGVANAVVEPGFVRDWQAVVAIALPMNSKKSRRLRLIRAAFLVG